MRDPAATEVDAPNGRPWNPTTIMWITMVLGGFPGFVLHTLNVKRLGLDQRFPIELAKNALGFILLFGIVLVDALPRIALMAVVLSLAAYFKASQQQAFRAHQASGGSHGSAKRAVLLSVGVIAAVLVTFGVSSEVLYQAGLRRFESLLEVGEWESAEQLAERQLALYPNDYAILWNRARLKAYRGDFVGLRADLRQMLRFFPDDPDLLDWLTEAEDEIAGGADLAPQDSTDGNSNGGAG